MKKSFERPIFLKGQHVKYCGKTGVVLDPNYELRKTYVDQMGTIFAPVLLVERDDGTLEKVTQTIVMLA